MPTADGFARRRRLTLRLLSGGMQYDEANKEVAILCNHQKGVSKNHDATMAKLLEKKEAMKAELKEASGAAVARIKCGAVHAPRSFACCADADRTRQGALGDSGPQHGVPRVAQERVARHQQNQLSGPSVRFGARLFETLSADARPWCSISVAWCKQHEVPIEKIYTKVLLEKFGVRVRAARGAPAAETHAVLCTYAVVHGDGPEL